MIPLAEINQAAEKYRVPAETIEKDYVICWILKCLSASKLKDGFVFYGGTAIKRMYFEDHRFSEDIDLISEKAPAQDFLITELRAHLGKAKDSGRHFYLQPSV
jgi:predicted nucleotidyltransferase component of viral defense system